MLIRSCRWDGKSANGWDTDLLEPNAEVSEDVKRAILGARRTVLFVEGNDNSLDRQIYEILFPNVTIVPKGNSLDVERATKGVRSTESMNWVTSYGLVDADYRTSEQLEEMISRLAIKQAQITGEDAGELEKKALTAALVSIRRHRDRLCARMVERKVRHEIVKAMPDHRYIAENDSTRSSQPIRPVALYRDTL